MVEHPDTVAAVVRELAVVDRIDGLVEGEHVDAVAVERIEADAADSSETEGVVAADVVEVGNVVAADAVEAENVDAADGSKH